jgi:hypothetical protein
MFLFFAEAGETFLSFSRKALAEDFMIPIKRCGMVPFGSSVIL